MAPFNNDPVQKFLTSQDLGSIDKPLEFHKHENWGSFLCIDGFLTSLLGCTIPCFCSPIQSLCQNTLARYHRLELHHDSVKVTWPVNDCCCHVAHNTKQVPLDKIQDVQLQEGCWHTLFGLKQVTVESAAGDSPEVTAAWLADPEQTRDALQLAVRLHRANPAAAPGVAGAMQRAGGPGGMGARLTELEQLVSRGALAPEEAARLRVPVLSAEADPLPRLAEAAGLADRGLISAAEYQAVKAAIIAQLVKAAAFGGGEGAGALWANMSVRRPST